MSKLNRIKGGNVATREMVERAFNECPFRTEDAGISMCGKIKTSCKYAINNGICEMLQKLAIKKKKITLE